MSNRYFDLSKCQNTCQTVILTGQIVKLDLSNSQVDLSNSQNVILTSQTGILTSQNVKFDCLTKVKHDLTNLTFVKMSKVKVKLFHLRLICQKNNENL